MIIGVLGVGFGYFWGFYWPIYSHRYESLYPMCLCATLGIKERFFGSGRQGCASHPFGVPLTELLYRKFINRNVVIYFV
ncbi:hypothetical protein AOC28_08565 [Polynucleobacter sp. MWH-Adler-W8]|nr:hypothetical protein AOC28_08565 [Polynucleobacter sp. MWH-Adler-W8]